MAQVIITINYREYAVSCDDGQEAQILKLGRQLDEKARALTSALGHINENQLLAMVGLLVADELNELKKTSAANTQQSAQPVQQQAQVTPQTPVTAEADFAALDTEFADSINSLNEAIKNVALQLKSL